LTELGYPRLCNGLLLSQALTVLRQALLLVLDVLLLPLL